MNVRTELKWNLGLCSHLRFEARDEVTTAPALAVGDTLSMATVMHELRGEKL